MYTFLVGSLFVFQSQMNTGVIDLEDLPKREAIVTAYSSVETCKKQCITASGKVVDSTMAACPRNLKFGTRVLINGLIYVCEDRTHERFDGRFDIFAGYGEENYQKARLWGKKNLPVYILPESFDESTSIS